MQPFTGWIRRLDTPGRWRSICSGESADECWHKLQAIRSDADSGMHIAVTSACVRPTAEGNPIGAAANQPDTSPPADPGDVPCHKCNGIGERKGKRCRNCRGTGYVGWTAEEAEG